MEAFIKELGTDFFTGVPDSQLKAFCDCLYSRYGIGEQHIVAQNEGGAVALASGHYLATGKAPCVYMQNSGIGNAVNPVCSLTNDKVYGIPMIFVIGWRGEPGVHDEPQHIFQGEKTLDLLEALDIKYFVVTEETDIQDIETVMGEFRIRLQQGKTVAFVVKKNALTFQGKAVYKNEYTLTRERAIELTLGACDEKTIVVSTTGKASRELFEIRERNGQSHRQDFLTVGSMGHSSMIGLGIALEKSDRRVCVIDGDGAVLMHTGAMAVIGSRKPAGFIHVILNNSAHETVGGMPTVFSGIDCKALALAMGYQNAWTAQNEDEVQTVMKAAKEAVGPVLVEIKVTLGARKDLGRPTRTPYENKQDFMEFLGEL